MTERLTYDLQLNLPAIATTLGAGWSVKFVGTDETNQARLHGPEREELFVSTTWGKMCVVGIFPRNAQNESYQPMLIPRCRNTATPPN